MKNILLVILFFTNIILSQPRDTSFTSYNAAQKVSKLFPSAKLVQPYFNQNLLKIKDIIYTSYGGRNMHLDLYSPVKKEKLYPAVLLIHGGGWRSGNKEMEIPMAQFLASNGFIAATLEYRLSPESKYPAALKDIITAIKWLRSNAGLYKIDTNKIVLYGCSSGGQIAALLGISNDESISEGFITSPGVSNMVTNHSSNIQAIIDIDGVLDMTDPNESSKDSIASKPSSAKAWLGYSFKDNPELWNQASPLNHVNGKSAPICFINSSLPRFHAGRDQTIQKLNKLGIYSEVHTIPQTPHEFWLFHPWFDLTSIYVLNFLNKIFNTN
jgi:acetyl esterase/lipase